MIHNLLASPRKRGGFFERNQELVRHPATTLEEAILWHGGEAEAAVTFYREPDQQDRDRLIRFLASL
ncbi:MAG: di-heme oxidoredictase family protein [Bacteroidia bacterium]|nr:di-heme oxidoredictase family protein [Bacteroidia bacterium]